MPKYRPRQTGFTLIEVMIVVAIIGILGSIAYPSYTEYVRKGHRASAKAALLQAAQWMERAATAMGTYPTDLPANLEEVDGDRYKVEVDSDGTEFTLTAKLKSGQSDPKCGDLTLTNTGARGASKGTVADCWGR